VVAYGPSAASMLASSADRERALDVLRAGLAEGRLTHAEFTGRVAQVQASRTYGQLSDLTADLPAGPAAPDRPSALSLLFTAIAVFLLAVLVTGGVILVHSHAPSHPVPAVPSTHKVPVPLLQVH
jgi:Domain of unknown function (DUF1707)